MENAFINDLVGLDEELNINTNKQVTVEEAKATKKPRAPFAVWEVGGEEYKLKLDTKTICSLESKLKTNLLNLIGDDIPSLSSMLLIIQGAIQKYQHGLKYEQVLGIYDKYVEEGKGQTELLTDVIIPIFVVSGFFTAEQVEDMGDLL